MHLRATALAVALLALAASWLIGRDNPHAFGDDPAACGNCHEGPPARPERLPDGSSEFCASCHTHPMNAHPLAVPADLHTPADLLVDREGNIGCLTCHFSHGPHESDHPWTSTSVAGELGRLFKRRQSYPTYFLRRDNSHGDLCLACHNNF